MAETRCEANGRPNLLVVGGLHASQFPGPASDHLEMVHDWMELWR
jgi:hypothetical protein